MEEMLLGVTDRTTLVFIPDPASTDGSGKTGLVAANLTVSFARVETDNDVTVSDVTGSLNDLSALTDAHNDWGWKEVSSTVAPGLYRLDLADAVFAAGAWMAVVYVMVTTSAAGATPKGYRLVAINALDAVRLGLTALPNAAAEAAGGLYTRGAGAGQINQNANGQIDSRAVALANDVITAASAAADFGTEIATAVWASATRTLTALTGGTVAADIRAAVGLAAADLDTQLDDVAASLVLIDNFVDDLEGRLTAALATALQAYALAIGRAVIAAGATTTSVPLTSVNGAAPSAVNDFYNGRVLVYTSGALTLQAVAISDYVGATTTLTTTASTAAPANTDTAVIV